MPEVVLYELNEVPWPVIDYYVSRRPESAFAHVLQHGRSLTTRTEDPASLSPWRTWPTLHNSMLTSEHNSYELGQDPSTFEGVPLWQAADAHGLRVGVFGALQSWPARPLVDGFYVPDTFAKTPDTIPTTLRTFQEFNLRMTADNAFSSDAPLSAWDVLRVGFSLVRLGLRLRTVRDLLVHLVQERQDSRYKAARAAFQALPSFDLYYRLHRTYKPHLSIFFTNHVASMMHRYWGDAMPAYAESYGYKPDPVFATFLLSAMDMVDAHLRVLLAELQRDSSRVLMIAASMGQAAVPPKEETLNLLSLSNPSALLAALGVSGEGRLAMHPKCSLEVNNRVDADAAKILLEQVMLVDLGPVFVNVEVIGSSLTFTTTYADVEMNSPPTVQYRRGLHGDPLTTTDLATLGLVCRSRLGGVNTAYHVPEGILVLIGGAIQPTLAREVVDVLDVAPSLLEHLGVPVPPSMRGRTNPVIFAAAHD